MTIPESAVTAAVDPNKHPWRAFHDLINPKLWGIEIDDPDIVEHGEETLIYPKMSQSDARLIVELHNKAFYASSQIEVADGGRAAALEEAARIAEHQGNQVPNNTKAFRAYKDACNHIAARIRALANVPAPSNAATDNLADRTANGSGVEGELVGNWREVEVSYPLKGRRCTPAYFPSTGEMCEVSGPNCDDANGYTWGKTTVLWQNHLFVLYGNDGYWPVLHKHEHVLFRPLPPAPQVRAHQTEGGAE